MLTRVNELSDPSMMISAIIVDDDRERLYSIMVKTNKVQTEVGIKLIQVGSYLYALDHKKCEVA